MPDLLEITDSSRSLGRPVPVVHVGHDQPAAIAPFSESQRELSDVGLPFLPREPANDVAHRALRRKCEGAQNERTARTLVVLLDRGASADGQQLQ